MSRFSGKLSQHTKSEGQKNKGIKHAYKRAMLRIIYKRAISIWNDGTGRIDTNKMFAKSVAHPYSYLPKRCWPGPVNSWPTMNNDLMDVKTALLNY